MSQHSVGKPNALAGKIAIVTGASRGLGKGIAIELGAAGATVYVTARGITSNTSQLGTIEETANEVNQAGGKGIAVHCDQAADDQIAALIRKVEQEQGRLDVLVNNAYPAPEVAATAGRPFWELPIDAWRLPIDVGLRSHYVTSVLAMPLLLKSHGLVANVSSAGGQIHFASVIYGIGKAGMDRMIRDMAVELKGTGVTTVSLWPGVVRTELLQLLFRDNPTMLRNILKMATAHFAENNPWANPPEAPEALLAATETSRFTGRAVAALAADPKAHEKTGRTLAVVQLADEYGFTDIDDQRPDAFHFRNLRFWPALAS